MCTVFVASAYSTRCAGVDLAKAQASQLIMYSNHGINRITSTYRTYSITGPPEAVFDWSGSIMTFCTLCMIILVAGTHALHGHSRKHVLVAKSWSGNNPLTNRTGSRGPDIHTVCKYSACGWTKQLVSRSLNNTAKQWRTLIPCPLSDSSKTQSLPIETYRRACITVQYNNYVIGRVSGIVGGTACMLWPKPWWSHPTHNFRSNTSK